MGTMLNFSLGKFHDVQHDFGQIDMGSWGVWGRLTCLWAVWDMKLPARKLLCLLQWCLKSCSSFIMFIYWCSMMCLTPIKPYFRRQERFNGEAYFESNYWERDPQVLSFESYVLILYVVFASSQSPLRQTRLAKVKQLSNLSYWEKFTSFSFPFYDAIVHMEIQWYVYSIQLYVISARELRVV